MNGGRMLALYTQPLAVLALVRNANISTMRFAVGRAQIARVHRLASPHDEHTAARLAGLTHRLQVLLTQE